MKRFYKLFAAAFAFALIATSPVATITSNAAGFNPGAHDDTDYGKRPNFDFSSDIIESAPAPAPSSPTPKVEDSTPAPKVEDNTPAPKVEDSGSGNSGSGFNQNAHDDTDYGKRPSENAPQTDSNDVTVKVDGGQPFRSVMSKEHTAYEVYHKGVSVASFAVTDAKGNVVTFSAVKLEKSEDGLWYLNITLPEGVDVKDLTITLTKGDLAYLAKELGITGIQLNGKVLLLTAPAEEKTDGKDTDTSDKKEAEKPKTEPESTAVGARVCWCGATISIANKGGLSSAEKAAWKAHAAAHLAKGESTSYTDVAY